MVWNPEISDNSNRASGEPNMAGAPEYLPRQTTLPDPPSTPPQREAPPVEASTDNASLQDKSDVSYLRMRDQQLAREMKRDTDKLGEVVNLGATARANATT
jgi:hypothetical protein